jgi:hypothetical protein
LNQDKGLQYCDDDPPSPGALLWKQRGVRMATTSRAIRRRSRPWAARSDHGAGGPARL